MSLPPSDFTLPGAAASQQPFGRGRSLARRSAILAVAAVIASAAWGPLMEIIAFALRPPQLSGSRLGYQQVAPYQHDAELRMWIILIASFLVILTLATLAIIYGQRALRYAGNGGAFSRLRRWGGIALIVSLLSVGLGVLVTTMPGFLQPVIFLPYAYTIRQFMYLALVGLIPVAAMSSLILNGMAARRAAVWSWLSWAVSALPLVFWFLVVAFVAQFTVAFYLHIVY